MVTVRGSEKSVEARLRAGRLACWCGGTLRPWGHARPRRVMTFAGLAEVVPRREICRGGCGRSHVLLPAWLLSRRKYAAVVIFAALALRAGGLKTAAVASRLRLPVPGRPGVDGGFVAVAVRRPGRAVAADVPGGAAAGRPAGPAGRGGRVAARRCAGRPGCGHRRAAA